MEKDFDAWNEKKKCIEKRQETFFFNEREVWWCAVGLNIASESCGKDDSYRRPVLILKKLSKRNFIGIPLSTQEKKGTWFTDIVVRGDTRYALLYQVRMFSASRFQRRLATLGDDDFRRVKEKLKQLLELSNHHRSENSGSVGNPKSN